MSVFLIHDCQVVFDLEKGTNAIYFQQTKSTKTLMTRFQEECISLRNPQYNLLYFRND